MKTIHAKGVAPAKVLKGKSASLSDAKYVPVPPNAGKTVRALREMGYGSFESILDIIDNSIDAKATKIAVTVKEISKGNVVIDIADNGVGMDRDRLQQALTLGSDVDHDELIDLGKFGMGLVTAGIGLARSIWVLTRKDKGQGFEARYDLDAIERHNDWLITLHEASSRNVLEHVGDHGTLVRLERIDRINDTNVARFAANLRKKVGQTYRHFIAKGLSITVNNRAVKAVDPLMLDHELTETKFNADVDLGGGKKAHLIVAELPELGMSGDAEADIYPNNSGFYVVRNGRQIMEAQTFGFYRHHHSYSHFRAELSFDGSLDTDFHVDIKKGSIHPNDRVLERLRDRVNKFIAESGRRGRDREDEPMKLSHSVIEQKLAAPAAPTKGKPGDTQLPAPSVKFVEADQGDNGRFYSAEKKDGQTVLTYNTRHPFVQLVGGTKAKQAHAIFDLFTVAMARTEDELGEAGRKTVNRVCDHLKALMLLGGVTHE